MNYYVVVEGESEKKVFEKWIKYVNPKLTYVDHVSLLVDDNYVIIMGGGYPNYLSMIEAGIDDISNSENSNNIRLVCCGDSEELTREERYAEIEACIKGKAFNGLLYSIIIQHFCLETWALGNRAIVPRNPNTSEVKKFRQHFDVLNNDPELLSPLNGGTRANYAFLYLRALLREKSKTAIYSKGDPSILYPITYFNQIKQRFVEYDHIVSFSEFSNAFL